MLLEDIFFLIDMLQWYAHFPHASFYGRSFPTIMIDPMDSIGYWHTLILHTSPSHWHPQPSATNIYRNRNMKNVWQMIRIFSFNSVKLNWNQFLSSFQCILYVLNNYSQHLNTIDRTPIVFISIPYTQCQYTLSLSFMLCRDYAYVSFLIILMGEKSMKFN